MAKSTLSRRVKGKQDSPDQKELRSKTNLTINNFDTKKLLEYFTLADRGRPEYQSRICQEILEKDWDIAQAHSARAEAPAAVPYEIVTAKGMEDNRQALRIRDYIQEQVNNICPHPETGLVGFDGLIENMGQCILPGFSCSQIIWKPAGAGVQGFEYYPYKLFTFYDEQHKQHSHWPLLKLKEKDSPVRLSREQWIVHTYQPRGSEITRGGLIRPLAFLFVLKHFNIKDWIRFLERFGQPFVKAFVDWDEFERNEENDDSGDTDTDREDLEELIANFGSDGGGIFPKDIVDIDLMEAINDEGTGFLNFQKYAERKINQLLLGQDSTSSAENSNRSTAAVHYMVKENLLIRDCKRIATSINTQLFAPMVYYRFGANAPVPCLKFNNDSAGDLKTRAEVIKTMGDSGYKLPEDAVRKTMGMPFQEASQNQESE